MRYEVSVLLHGRIFVESNSGDASPELIEQMLEEDITPEYFLSGNNARLMVDAIDIGQIKECNA
jgi:hypothetical protein